MGLHGGPRLSILLMIIHLIQCKEPHSERVSSWLAVSDAILNRKEAIELDPGVTIHASFEIAITNQSLAINGNGAVLDAGRKTRFFNISDSAALMLNNLTLQNGTVSS